MHVATEEAIYHEDMQHHLQKQITCRSTPVWGKHAAKKMLIKDVEDGIDQPMTKSSYGNHRPSIKPFLMTSFVSVLTRFSRKHLLHPIGSTKGTNTEGNNSIWRQMKCEKNGLWVLRWKR